MLFSLLVSVSCEFPAFPSFLVYYFLTKLKSYIIVDLILVCGKEIFEISSILR